MSDDTQGKSIILSREILPPVETMTNRAKTIDRRYLNKSVKSVEDIVVSLFLGR
ncbi:hypothetical protein K4L44_00365 [Halosquirtibacter laminarini]|uniref:Uncharacterized protein n=1 Tax=Halosquirtibacter laminarini TaxID=3374600 RepID=A0AC61NFP6_9BACT|nr:hypothetical protein K4L44_00365 [Prolixibacteraceae bacterium]